jgi:hypothetical protein
VGGSVLPHTLVSALLRAPRSQLCRAQQSALWRAPPPPKITSGTSSMVSAKATITATSLSTTTPITSDTKGPRASSSFRTAIWCVCTCVCVCVGGGGGRITRVGRWQGVPGARPTAVLAPTPHHTHAPTTHRHSLLMPASAPS